MFLFKYHGTLDPEGILADDEEFVGIGGAYVNVYVNFADYDGAAVLAEFYAKRCGWILDEEFEAFEISLDTLENEDEKALFKEAEEYGYTTENFMYPLHDEDEDEQQ